MYSVASSDNRTILRMWTYCIAVEFMARTRCVVQANKWMLGVVV